MFKASYKKDRERLFTRPVVTRQGATVLDWKMVGLDQIKGRNFL